MSMQSITVNTEEADKASPANKDKLNKVDFRWFIVRSLPHQERKLADLLMHYQEKEKNILEVYCPTHTTVNESKNGKEVQKPLFAGYVFVLSTQKTVTEFISRHYPEGTILYDTRNRNDKKARILTIPEEQMRIFKDFNENYADKLLILEKPFTDYAFNPKTNEPNETVKVIDGPLAGKEGYLTRFRRDKRLVFNMKALNGDRYYAVSVPNIWNFHVVRIHNAECDRQTIGTMKERAVDLLIGLIQACGYGGNTLKMLYSFIDELMVKPSLVDFCKSLYKKGFGELSRRIASLGTYDAELILNLIRYERDNRGYVKENFEKLVIRPFLTPTSGIELKEDENEATLKHGSFTEIIKKTNITELTYYPDKHKDELTTTTYFAHIGIIQNGNSKGVTLFANWDTFLKEYFLTAGKANEKLVKGTTEVSTDASDKKRKEKIADSFRNFAPTLHNILTNENSRVKAIQNLKIGEECLNVMAIETTGKDAEETSKAKDELISVCTNICKEISTTIHLAVWRRFLRTVWLHK